MNTSVNNRQSNSRQKVGNLHGCPIRIDMNIGLVGLIGLILFTITIALKFKLLTNVSTPRYTLMSSPLLQVKKAFQS